MWSHESSIYFARKITEGEGCCGRVTTGGSRSVNSNKHKEGMEDPGWGSSTTTNHNQVIEGDLNRASELNRFFSPPIPQLFWCLLSPAPLSHLSPSNSTQHQTHWPSRLMSWGKNDSRLHPDRPAGPATATTKVIKWCAAQPRVVLQHAL